MGSNDAAFETAFNLLRGLKWNQERAAEFAAALDGSALENLRNALIEEAGQRGDNTIVETVRETVAREYETVEGDPRHTPIAVVFGSDEWDNGWFLENSGTVFFADGSRDEGVEFPISDELTDAYGVVGSMAALGIDLRTGAAEFNAYGSQVYETLGVDPNAGDGDGGK